MYYFVTASKDSSIYLQQPSQNTGLDEVLEVSKVYYGSLKDISRTLIKFDINIETSFGVWIILINLIYDIFQSLIKLYLL